MATNLFSALYACQQVFQGSDEYRRLIKEDVMVRISHLPDMIVWK